MTPHIVRRSHEHGRPRSSSRRVATLAGAVAVVSLSISSAGAEPWGDPLLPTDAPTCAGYDPTIYGGPRDSDIEGTGGNDVIVAVGSSHWIYGYGGNDLICTFGPEGDHIRGGNGNDRVYAGVGLDDIEGGDGADRLYGGDANDSILGQRGDDYLNGGYGDDEMSGGAFGKDTADGGPGGDNCFTVDHRISCGLVKR